MKLATVLLTAAFVGLSVAAVAHAPKIGDNGGPQVDAGSYHVELVAKEMKLDVYLRDHAFKAVATDGFKGAALLVVDGKPHRIELAPAGGNRLTGTAPVSLPADSKGAVLITNRAGSTMQGKFN